MGDDWSAIIVGMLLAFFFFGGLDKSKEWETYYSFQCVGELKNDHCSGEAKAIDRVRVMLLLDQQSVVFSNDTFVPTTYQECSVYDSDNWMCQKPGDRLLLYWVKHGNFYWNRDEILIDIGGPDPLGVKMDGGANVFLGPAWKWYLVRYVNMNYSKLPF